MHEVVDGSLCKICHYQQNVLQCYYLLGTLVLNILHVSELREPKKVTLSHCKLYEIIVALQQYIGEHLLDL